MRGCSEACLEGSKGSTTNPKKRQGSSKEGVRPIEIRIALILLYQCLGLYRVFYARASIPGDLSQDP